MQSMQRTVLALTLCAAGCPRIYAAEKIDLQFRPPPEQKQTYRVTATMDIATQMGPQQMLIANSRTTTLAVEPIEMADNSTVLANVRFVAIQEKSGMKGAEPGIVYDSTKPTDGSDPLASHYSAFIGECCPVTISRRGEILELGTDDLFLAVARNIMEREDDMARQRLKERASDAIMKTDQRFGSREGRRQALKKQVEAFPLMNADRIRSLVGELIVRFPDAPVQQGERWQIPLATAANTPLAMTGTCTLTAAARETCTIQISAERAMDDPPIVTATPGGKTTAKLGGTCTATVNVDPTTGLLLDSKTRMKFSGETQRHAAQQSEPMTAKMAMEGTTTVERIE
ncbi:DUF6263 family protein [Anaerobaca lacustris]|uniref:DUF6263 family protein n=1 Tax=Anaerobaca lacustris TaxID=3044600 RepID=A0AAW6TUH7_9BACT|nr:DUF6263 family protein [Sedimentisphaerales bacterium M17dextr]